jgi:hypothetical protein
MLSDAWDVIGSGSIDHLWQACSAEAAYTIVEENCGACNALHCMERL